MLNYKKFTGLFIIEGLSNGENIILSVLHTVKTNSDTGLKHIGAQKLADLVGCDIMSVNRALLKFEEHKLIEVHRPQVKSQPKAYRILFTEKE